MFEFIRKQFFPFNEIVKLVPTKGIFLDVGCGHGILSKLLAKTSINRQVTGIDPSAKKITLAKSRNKYKNLKFRKAFLEDIRSKYNGICVIDVLYLLPVEEKLKFFKQARSRLYDGGLFIFSEINPENKLLLKILQLEETIMVKILKYTYTNNKNFNISSIAEYKQLVKKAGFKLVTVKKIKGRIPYPRFIIIAK